METEIRVSPEEARRLFEAGGTVFLDVRGPKAYAESAHRLPGAVRIPVADLDARAGELDRAKTIIACCT